MMAGTGESAIQEGALSVRRFKFVVSSVIVPLIYRGAALLLSLFSLFNPAPVKLSKPLSNTRVFVCVSVIEDLE